LEGEWLVRNNSTGLFPELTLEELVFLHHEYYSIFLLQQEASALGNTAVINNNGILIHFS
jgi:translation initiation factor 6 (eIF-6)